LRLVCFDSTGPHNRSWFRSHGRLDDRDVEAIGQACDGARAGELVALLLHHHVLPLPPDHPAERVPRWFGWNVTCELARGHELLDAIAGRCDLVLHGHRHTPARRTLLKQAERPLRVYNAGSSTELGDVRLFTHAGGRLTGPPVWLSADEAFAPSGEWSTLAGRPFVAA
jgi:3',5'-cyclic AMP phosphodiesterase CpdA